MDLQELITIDWDTLGGQPVFKGTRVTIETLFDHLEAGISLDEFLDDFPTVSKQQAIAALEIAGKLMTSKNVAQLYEAVAWWKSSQKIEAWFSRSWDVYRSG